MDKSVIIEATRNQSLYPEILYEYCIEHGKTTEDADKLVSLCYIPSLAIKQVLTEWYEVALEYYQRQFEISIVKDKIGRLVTVF